MGLSENLPILIHFLGIYLVSRLLLCFYVFKRIQIPLKLILWRERLQHRLTGKAVSQVLYSHPATATWLIPWSWRTCRILLTVGVNLSAPSVLLQKQDPLDQPALPTESSPQWVLGARGLSRPWTRSPRSTSPSSPLTALPNAPKPRPPIGSLTPRIISKETQLPRQTQDQLGLDVDPWCLYLLSLELCMRWWRSVYFGHKKRGRLNNHFFLSSIFIVSNSFTFRWPALKVIFSLLWGGRGGGNLSVKVLFSFIKMWMRH